MKIQVVCTKSSNNVFKVGKVYSLEEVFGDLYVYRLGAPYGVNQKLSHESEEGIFSFELAYV